MFCLFTVLSENNVAQSQIVVTNKFKLTNPYGRKEGCYVNIGTVA